MTFQLLKCLARALAKHGGKFVCSLVPGAEGLYEIATDTLKDYLQHRQEDALRGEVQALAQAPAEQVRQEVQDAVAAEAAALPADVQEKIAAYLTQVPALIRRSLRRPSDPTGMTVPAAFALRRADDLLPLLPTRPPRFQRGDRPLPGVDWVLEEPLGVGGFGEVWKARHAHMRSKQLVALKFCLDPAVVPVLRNETGILDRVMQHGRHPGIVPLLQTYLGADPPCLEYEYVEGSDLASLIQELHEREQPATRTANDLLLRLAEIVAFAHQADPPIVHGDLKPANVLVRRGEKQAIDLRVTDFGIGGLAAERAARQTRQPTQSRQTLLTEAVRGAYTPLYASPQQMLRRPGEPADPRDDVHALGVIWYQLVTGDLGLMSIPPDWREQTAERGLGEPLARLLASCIAPKAEKRPANALLLAEQVKAALEGGEQGQPIAGPQHEPAPLPDPTRDPVPAAPEVWQAARPTPVRPEGPQRPAQAEPREAAEEAVFWPAVWLLNAGGLLCLGAPIFFLIMLFTGAFHRGGYGLDTEALVWFLVGGVVVFALGVVILRAGLHLLRLRSRTVALVGSIVMVYLGALTLILFGAGLLFLPAGIWATRVLRRKEVKSAFASGGSGPDRSPAEEAVFWPAVWLLNAGGLLCLGAPILFFSLLLTGAFHRGGYSGGARWLDTEGLVWCLVGGVVVVALGVVILRSGIHLLKLRSRTVALVGSIVMIYLGVLTLLLFGAGLLFLPAGIWATRALRRKDVKATFGR